METAGAAQAGTFAYHEGATIRLAALMLPLYVPVEILVVRSLVPPGHRWMQLVHGGSWLLVLLLIWATCLSMKRRPHRVSKDGLVLHRGLWGHARVPAELVAAVEPLPERPGPGEAAEPIPRTVTVMTVRGVPEVELRLEAPIRPVGLLGPRPETRTLRISVNDRRGFQAAVLAARADARRANGLS
jgi:hypothetical protein